MIEEKHLLKKNAPAKRLRQTNNVGAIKNETLRDLIKCMQGEIYTTENE